MADSLVTTGAPPTTLDGRSAVTPAGEVLRDVARGGIAGIIVSILVAGLGGRLVMRLATILHQDTVGLRTENGEVIGAITLGVGVPIAVYLVVTAMGLVLILPIVVDFLMSGPEYRTQIHTGWGLACVGLCTLTWWVLRVRGRSAPPRALRLAGQASLLFTVVLGVVTTVPQVGGAVGVRW